MFSLAALFQCMGSSQLLWSLDLNTVLCFIRLSTTLHPILLHRQKPSGQRSASSTAPAQLPDSMQTFLAQSLGTSTEAVTALWTSLGTHIWDHGLGLIGEDHTPATDPDIPEHSSCLCKYPIILYSGECTDVGSADKMIYPRTTVCTDPLCPANGRVLRLYDNPKRVVLFSLADGVYEGYAVHLKCTSECQSHYQSLCFQ